MPSATPGIDCGSGSNAGHPPIAHGSASPAVSLSGGWTADWPGHSVTTFTSGRSAVLTRSSSSVDNSLTSSTVVAAGGPVTGWLG